MPERSNNIYSYIGDNNQLVGTIVANADLLTKMAESFEDTAHPDDFAANYKTMTLLSIVRQAKEIADKSYTM